MIDPQIPLAASPGPAPLNPVQTLAGIGQLRQQQQQQALGEQQLESNAQTMAAQQRAQVEDQRLRALFAKGIPSAGDLYSTVGPVRGNEILKGLAAFRGEQLTTSKAIRDTVGSMAGGILALPPTMQEDAYTMARKGLLTRGVNPEDVPEQFPGADGLKQIQIWAQTPEQQITAAETARAHTVSEAQAKATADAAAANTAADNKRADAQLQVSKDRVALARQTAASGGAGTKDDADAIADSIIDGDQPPVLTGLYRLAGPVRSALAKKGYKLADAMTDWNATQKHINTLNGSQQTRMRQAVDNAYHSIDVIEDLAKQWDGGRFPILNRAELKLAKGGALGAQAQQIATQLEAQISDVTSELGNVYMGGNSPTDHALGLAGKNLSADWTKDQLLSALKLARTNLQIRSNSMKNVGPAGASATNPYAPPDKSVTGPDAARTRVIGPNGETGTVPARTTLPAGWKAAP